MKKFIIGFMFCFAFLVSSSAMEIPIIDNDSIIDETKKDHPVNFIVEYEKSDLPKIVLSPDSIASVSYANETFPEGADIQIKRNNVYYSFVDHSTGDVYLHSKRSFGSPKDPPSTPTVNVHKWISAVDITVGVWDNHCKGVANIQLNEDCHSFLLIGNIRF